MLKLSGLVPFPITSAAFSITPCSVLQVEHRLVMLPHTLAGGRAM